MKCHIVLGFALALALIAPLGGAAPVDRAEVEDLVQAVDAADSAEPVVEAVEEAEEVDASDVSDEPVDPQPEISNDYFIDVKDNTRPPHPWWW